MWAATDNENSRKRNKEMEIVKANEIIKKGSFGVLATIGKDGYPYGVPLNYTYFDNCIFLNYLDEKGACRWPRKLPRRS